MWFEAIVCLLCGFLAYLVQYLGKIIVLEN